MGKSRTVTVSVIETGTTISILLSRSSGFPGTVTVSGKLFIEGTANILRSKNIDLLINGAKVASALTDSSGLYRFTRTVAAGTYTFQARFNGDGLYTASWSPVRTGTYALVATDFLNFDVNPITGGGPLAVTILGLLRRIDTGGGLPGKLVKLYRNKNGGSFSMIKSMTSKTTSPGQGAIEFHDTLSVIGEYGYYVEFAGDSQFEGCEASDGSIVLDGEPPNGNGDGVAGGAGVLLLIALVLMTQE